MIDWKVLNSLQIFRIKSILFGADGQSSEKFVQKSIFKNLVHISSSIFDEKPRILRCQNVQCSEQNLWTLILENFPQLLYLCSLFPVWPTEESMVSGDIQLNYSMFCQSCQRLLFRFSHYLCEEYIRIHFWAFYWDVLLQCN